ncbi:hypothetical protein ACHAWC_000723 [Mediolabrus comicus]
MQDFIVASVVRHTTYPMEPRHGDAWDAIHSIRPRQGNVSVALFCN